MNIMFFFLKFLYLKNIRYQKLLFYTEETHLVFLKKIFNIYSVLLLKVSNNNYHSYYNYIVDVICKKNHFYKL